MRGKGRWHWLLFAGFFVLAVAVGLYFWLRPGMAVRTELLPGAVVRSPLLSPDGKFLTYTDDKMQLRYLMNLASGTVRELGPWDAGASWSADGRYLYVDGKEADTLYEPGMAAFLPPPQIPGDGWGFGWAIDAPWLAVGESDKSITLHPISGEGAPVPLFSSWVDSETAVINREGPSLGERRTNGRELLQVERPGEPEKVVASAFRWLPHPTVAPGYWRQANCNWCSTGPARRPGS